MTRYFSAASSSRTPVKTSRIQQSLQGTPNETKIRQLEAKLAGIYIFNQLYSKNVTSLFCPIYTRLELMGAFRTNTIDIRIVYSRNVGSKKPSAERVYMTQI